MLSPQFIPLRREKEKFVVSSWRDSPSVRPQVVPSTLVLPNSTAQPPSYPSADPVAPGSASPSAKAQASGRKSRSRPKGAVAQKYQDVDDFFVHCVLPPGVKLKEVEYEIQSHGKPLRVLDVGPPRIVGSPPPSVEASRSSTPPQQTPNPFHLGGGADTKDSSPSDDMPPAMALPPSVPTDKLATGHLLCFLYAESDEARKVATVILAKWPLATVEVVSRNRGILNASLVVKNLSNIGRGEEIIAELDRLAVKPSYVRLHRGERGVFKNVIFVKYPTRDDAELCKLQIERLVVDSRPFKVEFKKKMRENDEMAKAALMQQTVRDLRVSKDHEGFHLKRIDLSMSDVKTLKQLCHTYGMQFELTDTAVTVRRVLPFSEKPSPALRPSGSHLLPPPTPSWLPATPGSLQPMEFKGIRHWKDIRSQGRTLGILRPHGPDEGPAFPAGRGRPVQ